MSKVYGFLRSTSLAGLISLPALGSGCASSDGETTDSFGEAANAAGALIDVKMTSRVGVVLDELPPAQRAAAAQFYLKQPTAFWTARAKHQIKHTNYRLIYRNFYYDDKQMLALPPEEVWQIDLAKKGPQRVTTPDGHDAVEVAYTLTSTILTDTTTPGISEPKLGRVGGVWKEPFNLPLDPEFLFQRTGFACMDEDGYPLGTARSENAHQLFDQDCDVETPDSASCHLTGLPTESCLDALANHVGRIDTELRFERVRFDADRANAVRVGVFTHPSQPDLAVLRPQLANNWIEYRYVAPDSCSIAEQCVGGPGWRRLLLFDASINNKGGAALEVGATEDGSPALEHNLFEFSECHQHYHFRHYGEFSFGAAPGDKRAFCVESTDRYFNNEKTPLAHDFSCENQGVAPGWGDTYIAGVECNWIDITDVAIPSTGTTENLRFELNPDAFLCEGTPVLDANGDPVYEPTSFVTETGDPVDRPVCDFARNYSVNNVGTRAIHVPKDGGLTTSACTRKQAGPLRDCGFTEQQENIACARGKTVQLTCNVPANASNQVLRVCENSAKLGGIACSYSESLANVVVENGGKNVSFKCPAARGAGEPGGTYAIYTAPVLPTDSPAKVTCTPR